jgi:tetratricopeptide (TPR) repeat protein
VSAVAAAAPPSPEMRQSMRVLDLFVLDNDPRSQNPSAQTYYDQALKVRKSGKIEEAIRLYGAAYEADPSFLAAYNEVGVLLMQTGNLRDALKVYLSVVDRPDAGEQKYIAANNACDVYLTWFDAGRNRERNIERATHFAQMAMAHPTPMRACNLLLCYVKDRYFIEAREVMDSVLRANVPACPSDKFLQTLFQIRDPELVAWWNWLDGELEQANPKENR